jgi:chaperonin GroES
MSENLSPLYDRVVVERFEEERKTASGIVIPESAQEKPIRGKVIQVGRGKRLENGDFAAMLVKAGDTVVFGKYAGTEVKLNGKEYIIMREDDILAIVK